MAEQFWVTGELALIPSTTQINQWIPFIAFSQPISIAKRLSISKRDSRRHYTSSLSEYVVVAEQVIKCKQFFIILLPGEGLTSFSINNRYNFFGEKK